MPAEDSQNLSQAFLLHSVTLRTMRA